MDKLYHRLLRTIIAIIAALFIYFLFKYTMLFLYPFIIAILISLFLHPIVSYMEVNWKWKRNIATITVMLLFIILFSLLSLLFLKILLEELSALLQRLPNIFPTLLERLLYISEKMVKPIFEKLSFYFPSLGLWENVDFQYYYENITNYLTSISTDFLKEILAILTTVLTSLTYTGTISIFILLSSYILTKDMNFFQQQGKNWLPKNIIHKMNTIYFEFKRTTYRFIKAQIIIALISSTIIFIFLLIFQISHAFTITIIIFFVDFIPYVGIGIIFIPWILFLFVSGDYSLTIQLASSYIMVIIIRQLLEPKIIASSIKIHPIFSVIILFVSFQLWGLFGIVLTPIILISISTIYHTRILHYVWKFITE